MLTNNVAINQTIPSSNDSLIDQLELDWLIDELLMLPLTWEECFSFSDEEHSTDSLISALEDKRDGFYTRIEASELDISGVNFTQLGAATLVARAFSRNIKYDHTRKKWMIWDGKRWKPDINAEIHRKIMKTITLIADAGNKLLKKAKKINEKEFANFVISWAEHQENIGTMNAIASLTSTLAPIAVTVDFFDRDSFLFNVENGTLNLHTGEIYNHNLEDYVSLISSITYLQEATCPVWDRFLLEATNGDTALIRYLQQVVGMALTGDVTEQLIFIIWGPSGSGKSTFIEIVRNLLGDYARQSDISTFVISRGSDPNSPRSDLARLYKARFVAAVETESGQKWAEGLLKRLSGGDMLTARFLFQEAFEFKPEFKLFFALNDKPEVKPEEEAIWRRIRLIPFVNQIDEGERDNGLTTKLLTELPGILNWAIAGCLDWQQNGLMTPLAVDLATKDYREEMDVLTEFFDDCLILNPQAKVDSSLLYNRYRNWCLSLEGPAITQTAFGKYLRNRKFKSIKGTKGRRMWEGIDIK